MRGIISTNSRLVPVSQQSNSHPVLPRSNQSESTFPSPLGFPVVDVQVEENIHTINPLTSKFSNWILEAKTIEYLLNCFGTDKDLREKVYRYLLHSYTYNAPFTGDELDRLSYQTSPIALASRHSYVRSSKTPFMDLATEILKKLIGKEISTLWIDHANFLNSLDMSYSLFKETCIQDENNYRLSEGILKFIKSWCDEHLERSMPHGRFVYIILENLNADANPKYNYEEAVKITKEIQRKTKKRLAMAVLKKNGLLIRDKVLLDYACFVVTDGQAGKSIKKNAKLNTEALEFLNARYGTLVEQDYKNWRLKLEATLEKKEFDNEDFKFLFDTLNQKLIAFKNRFKELKSLADFKYYISTREEFKKEFLESALKLVDQKMSDENCSEQFLKKCQEELCQLKQNNVEFLKSQLGIFYLQSFHGLTVLLSVSGGKPFDELVHFLGNIGYAPDSQKFICSLIRQHNNFFPVSSNDVPLSLIEQLVKKNLVDGDLSKAVVENFLELPQQTPQFIETLFNQWFRKFESLGENANVPDYVKLYTKFIAKILHEVLQIFQNTLKPEFRIPMLRIISTLEEALQNWQIMSTFIHAVQNMMEAFILILDLHPFFSKPTQTLCEHLAELHVMPQQPIIHFTAYAMKSFTHIFQALWPSLNDLHLQNNVPKIQIFNQSYFELLHNMERISERMNVIFSRFDNQLEDCNLYFIDIHPNNAVESQLFSHNLQNIFFHLQGFAPKPRTLVVDVTLNAITDNEIGNILKIAKHLISSGNLNLIFIQSLTKFAQIGVDKLSAGTVYTYNNGEKWNSFNENLARLQKEETVYPATIQFFTFLIIQTQEYQRQYIHNINKNTQALYENVLKQYSDLNIPLEKKILALTCNTDSNTCYLAFSTKGILDNFNFADKLSSNDLSELNKVLIKNLFIPIAQWLNLPLTERMSIGFPMASINECGHAIRLTIGLEKPEELDLYAQMIAYICFVTNRETDPSIFFESKDECNSYFAEKVAIFKAMTPMKDKLTKSVKFKIPVNGQPNMFRLIKLNNGSIEVSIQMATSSQSLNSDQIFMSTAAGNNDVVSSVTKENRRFLAACFTNIGKYPSVNILHINEIGFSGPRVKALYFSNFFNIRSDNTAHNRFGRYRIQNFKVHIAFDLKPNDGFTFSLIGKIIKKGPFSLNNVLIKKGDQRIPFSTLEIKDQVDFFMRAYHQLDRSDISIDGFWYKPLPDDNTLITYNQEHKKIEIERDFLLFQLHGCSIFYRLVVGRQKEKVAHLDIEFWSIKDPVQSRFLTILLAYQLYEKKISFAFIDYSYQKIALLKEDLDKYSNFLKEHTNKILSKWNKIKQLLDNDKVKEAPKYQQTSINNYCFYNDSLCPNGIPTTNLLQHCSQLL